MIHYYYYADSKFSDIDLQLVISAIVTSTIVLMGITLVLVLVFVYLASKKSSRGKNTTNERYSF